MVERLLLCVELLGEFPMAGRIVPEIGRPEYRERILGNYRVVYRLQGERVEVLTVHHAARRFDPPAEEA